jgi:hypothetical protein
VLHLIFDGVPGALLHQRRIEAEAAAVQALIALAEYHRAHGALPETLTDAPTDPFSGEPLRYAKSPARVWSVGPDGVDNGGVLAYSSDEKKGDLIFTVPFVAAETSVP